tara:strand:- start:624 stop:866 length:243 start_codon:yes stop_codon:yes gene_type:complete
MVNGGNMTKEKNTISLNDKKYKIKDMNDLEKNYLAHITDLNKNIERSKFNIQQLEVSLNHFINLLNNSLTKEKESANRSE